MISLKRTGALAALLLTLTACDDSPSGPGDPGSDPGDPVHLWVGTYQLASVDGQALPAVVYEGIIDVAGGQALLRVLATEGTLSLTADGRYELQVRHAGTLDGEPAGGFNWTDRGTYGVQDDGFAFSSTYIENVAFQGQGDGDAVITRQDIAGEGRVVGYRFGRF